MPPIHRRAQLKKLEETLLEAKKQYNELFHELVTEQIQRRIDKGMETYGTPLKPFNGRDALQDALEEAIDLVFYLTQAIYERDYKE